MKIKKFTLKSVLLIGLVFSQAGRAEESTERSSTRPCQGESDYVLPSVTFVPSTDVVVELGQEFQVEKMGDRLRVTHVGPARRVRLSSIVAIGKHVELNLKSDGTEYCIVSSVALLGGTITVNGPSEAIGTISAVGLIRYVD